MLTRRFFLRNSALAMAGFGAAPAWLERAIAGSNARNRVLVAIFQRGAADGLNIVAPFGDKRYYELRPGIAIPAPAQGAGKGEAALDLDGFFGLHPALAPLKPLWDEGALAIVHAAGSPDPTRSHFDAQDYMEAGTPGVKSTRDGWLNRSLEAESAGSPVRAVAIGETLPRALRGRNSAIALRSVEEFQVRGGGDAFQSMYASTRDPLLSAAGRETFEAVELLKAISREPYAPEVGAGYPRGRFGESLRQIARLIKSGAGLEVAFTDIGGWDHHVNEVARQPWEGQLANLLGQFAQGLSAFWRDLGERSENVAVVTMSEFGRTARENGNRGTDHGHGNVMLALGGGIRGGKVYGDWPGLESGQLYEGRDLAVTTDFRAVLGELVNRQLGNRDLAAVFPGYKGGAENFRGIVKG